MFRVIRKADIVLFCALLLLAAVSAVCFALRMSQDAGEVVVTLDGNTYGTYSMTEDAEIEIRTDEFYNVIRIENGSVFMESSDCHNQVCVDHAPISHAGESIICLPHKLIVQIEGGKEADVDAIAK